MADLAKEVWTNQLMQNFYPDSAFLSHAKDFSGLVDNDAINMAEAGVDPEVLINNTTYPIKTVERTDKPLRIELDTFETENTLVRRPEAVEYSYDKLETVLMAHRNTLRARTAEKAAHAFAPQKDSVFTPVIQTSGETVGNRKRLSIEDILNLKERFDDANVPLENRFLTLNPKHLTDLILIDTKAFKDITDIVNGVPRRFAGFGILQFSRPAFYNGTTFEKVPWGEVATDEHTFCSFAFQGDEVMKADGSIYMYAKEDDPEQRATIVGFDKRFIAVPIRDRAIGAIVSKIV